MSSVNFHKRISDLNSEVQDIQNRLKEMDAQFLELGKRATALHDKVAAIRDARAGIYDKWYRNHRKNNSNYDTAWNSEKELMILEGYGNGWQVIEG